MRQDCYEMTPISHHRYMGIQKAQSINKSPETAMVTKPIHPEAKEKNLPKCWKTAYWCKACKVCLCIKTNIQS